MEWKGGKLLDFLFIGKHESRCIRRYKCHGYTYISFVIRRSENFRMWSLNSGPLLTQSVNRRLSMGAPSCHRSSIVIMSFNLRWTVHTAPPKIVWIVYGPHYGDRQFFSVQKGMKDGPLLINITFYTTKPNNPNTVIREIDSSNKFVTQFTESHHIIEIDDEFRWKSRLLVI